MVMERPFKPTGTLKEISNPVRFSETPVMYQRPPPALGEHTAQVCAELLGMSVEKLKALRKAGTI
jgi:crotonobetainyl-CoA:carnitine CoA-transferase CaiB-like acyl-CoA transferase